MIKNKINSMQPSFFNLPSFFNYKEENTDTGYETIQDFYLSWALRCSEEKYNQTENLIHELSKKITCQLLEIQEHENVTIENVKTFRQWKKIDLIAEITISFNSEKTVKQKKYLLNIENKWYSNIGINQLSNNKYIIESYYNKDEWEILNYVIFCDDSKINEYNKVLCSKNDYKLTSISELQSNLFNSNRTGNTVFDMFWFWNNTQ